MYFIHTIFYYSKCSIIAFTIDRVNIWKVRFFTKGGKEVLLESVATCMPTHVISCLRLPKIVTNKLQLPIFVEAVEKIKKVALMEQNV